MKILTQNLYCHKPWDKKKDFLIKEIKKIEPDIICFQELANRYFSNKELSEIKEINKNFPNYQIYANNSMLWGPRYKPNQAILVMNNSCKVLNWNEEDFKRKSKDDGVLGKYVWIKINRKGKIIWLFNLHLSNFKKYRYLNWKELKDFICKNVEEKENILIVGDLNTYDESIKNKEDVEIEIEKDGFMNIWKVLRQERPITFFSSNWWLKNYPKSKVSESIIRKNKSWDEGQLDYIFCKGKLKFEKIEYFNFIPYISDHRGLFSEFEPF